MDRQDFNAQIDEIVAAERSIKERLAVLNEQYADVFDELEKLDGMRKEVEAKKADLKSDLIAAEDFDTYDSNPAVRVSVTRIAKVAVKNIDEVPTEFKETKVVADDKKAAEYLRVMGEPPAGFTDRSYYRFNWVDKEEDD